MKTVEEFVCGNTLSERLQAIADSGDCGGGFDELAAEARILETNLQEALSRYRIRTELNENQSKIIRAQTAQLNELRDRVICYETRNFPE